MNESYFSQYESPNIVIVPTMSCNLPPAKRRKFENNIIVPIVNNVTFEKQKLKLIPENKKPEILNSDKKIEKVESTSNSPSLKASWASNYLESIGLDKTSTIWSRKIPRKSSSQTCDVSVKPSKQTTNEVTPNLISVSKTNIEDRNRLKIPYKTANDSIVLKNNSTKIELDKTNDRNYAVRNTKISKQSKSESGKSVSIKNSSGVKKTKMIKILTCNNKNTVTESTKIKRENIKSESLEQTTKSRTSTGPVLPKKIEKTINVSQKAFSSKLCTEKSTANRRQESQNKVKTPNIKSVVLKKENFVKDNKKYNIKTTDCQSKSDNIKPSTSHSTNNYKEKYKTSKGSTENRTTKNNVNVTNKYNKNDLNELVVSKKLIHKNKVKKQKKTDIPIKSQETKGKLLKKKSDLTLNKKITKCPNKRKTAKTQSYTKKIRLVINLICNNKPNSSRYDKRSSNESNSVSPRCTVSNVDLEFLNDFDVDEIVDCLDTCEKKTSQRLPHRQLNKEESIRNIDKHSMITNIQNSFNNTDAIELIKTLKGEEDDDLTRISVANAKDLIYSNKANIQTQSSEMSHVVPIRSNNNTKLIDPLTVPVKIEEPVSSDVSVDLNIVKQIINGQPSNVSVCNIKEHTQLMIKKADESKYDDHQSSSDNLARDILGTLFNKHEDHTILKNQQNIKPNISDENSFSLFTKVQSNTCEELKLHEGKTQYIDQKHSDSLCNKKSNLSNNSIDQQNSRSPHNEDQDKNKSQLSNEPQKISNIINCDKIDIKFMDGINSAIADSSNVLQNEIINKALDSTNESNLYSNASNLIHQTIPENLNHEHLNDDRKLKDNKADGNNENCNKATIKNSKKDYNVTNQVNSWEQKKTHVEDNDDNCILISNIKEKPEILDDKVQKDIKVERSVEAEVMNHKQKDLLNNNSNYEALRCQKSISAGDENTRGNIKSKVDLEIVLNLEERLFTYTGSKYCITSIIQTGKFSKIFKCKHPNGKYYALKMPTSNITYNMGKEKKNMLFSLLNDIPKDNLFIVYLANAFNMGEKWCFLMDYYPQNLDQALSEAGRPFSIENIQDYARQLIMAVMVLRNKNMVHLDIKPKHILINVSNTMLKLCGFDNLCYINKMNVLPNVGTVNYRAPEVILGYKSGFEIDVWSTALVLYEMATNKKLFPGIYNNDILYKISCTLGFVPNDMIKKSQFSGTHFVGTKFMKKSGFKGQNISLITKFRKNNKLCDSIYNAYFENWSHHRNVSQQNSDISKISLFVKLLQKMLTVHPQSRLPIEFVYANPFIYDGYAYQDW